MIRSPFANFGFYGTLLVMGVGAFALLPGDETARPAVDRIATIEPEHARPSYIVEGAPAPIATVETIVETASVSPTTSARVEQDVPAPLTSEPEPVTTASLTVTTPPADSNAFPMDVVEPEAEAGLPPNAEQLNVTSAVNMRVGPSTSTSTIKVLPAGEPVAVLGRNRGWINVMLADGQSGWVYQRYLSDGSAPAAEPQRDEERTASVEPRRERVVDDDERDSGFFERRRTRVVEDDEDDRGYFVRRTVELRDRPSRSGMPLFRIRRGEPVQIAEQRGNWVRIRVDGGISGWVQTRYIAD